MSGDSNIGAWIQFAKLTAAAGEMAPFPYIKGVAGCIATILEVIELAGKNNEDLRDLAESIGTTIRIIKETVEAHGETSATRFRDVCVELQTYLESLIAELSTTRRNVKSKSITRFLRTKKISGVIDGYKQRVNNIKADYLVLVTTDSRFAMSEMQDAITSTVKSQAHCIRSEIRSLGNIQREHAARICEKLQDLKGYYKGQVRELFPGDIYIKKLVFPFWRDSAIRYQGIYTGTVECSSTAKIIRVYQHSPDNEEATLKRFNDDADALIKMKHPNVAQVFGICRSPNFPVIVFHGTTLITFGDYQHNLTAKQFVRFYVQLSYDLESVSEYLSRQYTLSNRGSLAVENYTHLNEHGQIVVTDMVSSRSNIGVLYMYISDTPRLLSYFSLLRTDPEVPLSSQINRSFLSVTLRKDNLCNVYDAIKSFIPPAPSQFFSPQNELYVPGSILTSHGGALVGRIQTILDEWNMHWKTPVLNSPAILWFPSTNNGSITVPLPYAGTRLYHGSISPCSFDELLNSWIAQASQLQSCVRSRGHVDDDELFLIGDVEFTLRVDPEERYDPFRLCNTFMAEDHHTLSLSISAPSVDYQTTTLSWPVFRWFYDADSEMSSNEVEEVFGVTLFISGESWVLDVSKTMLKTVPELNADYGFDPARGGADVCEYFGWPLMEILDDSTGDWMPFNGTISESASVISDDGHRTLGEKTASSPGNALEGGHVGEASTEIEIATAVQTRDLESSCGSRVFIAMSFVINIILLFFVIQTYM